MSDINQSSTPERVYISDAETWAIFVGNETDPAQFIRPYDVIDFHDAIDNYVADYPWDDEPQPSWLEDSLRDYILAYLA